MKMIIDGKKVDASDGRVIEVFNPATMKLIDTVPAASKVDVEQAINAAVHGFTDWSREPLWYRIEVVRKFHKKLKENANELAHLLVSELGKPIAQAHYEVGLSIENVEAYIEGAHLLGGDSFPPSNRQSSEGSLILTVREPVGVVIGIVPFNFPLGTMTHKTIPGIIMGNSVIVKPASETPLAGIRFVELLQECGVPGNVVQIVTGKGEDIGDALINDSRIAAVTMTGSTYTGSQIAEICGRRLHHLSLEMGGNDPFIVLPDADIELAVGESVWNRLSNSGQTCCASKRYIVHKSIFDRYLERLMAALKEKVIGDPLDYDTDCGPLVSVSAAEKVEKQIQHCISQGAKLIYGGQRYNHTFFEPTILLATPDMDVAQDLEIFGPVWTIIEYETREEALAIANNTIYGLSSAVIGSSISDLLWFAKRIKAGTCVINGASLFESPESPFGGIRKSGVGARISVEDSLKDMSELKTIAFKGAF